MLFGHRSVILRPLVSQHELSARVEAKKAYAKVKDEKSVIISILNNQYNISKFEQTQI